MNIKIVAPAKGCFRWQADLAGRLRAAGHVVTWESRDATAWPVAIRLLLDLETLVYRGRGERPSDMLRIVPNLRDAAEFKPDLCLDLSGNAPVGQFDLHLRYDDDPEPAAAIEALIDGRVPRLDVVRVGCILETGQPANERPALISAGLDQVFARAADLCFRAVARLVSGGRAPPQPVPLTALRRRHIGLRALGFSTSRLAAKANRLLLRRLKQHEAWRVGVRSQSGSGILETRQVPETGFRWLPDGGDRYYADPFVFGHQGRTWLFVEEYPYATSKGVIAACEILPDGRFGETRVVLEEPAHLSYPHVFAQDGQIWMIPESSAAGDVVLYRATQFPWRWERERVLLSGLSVSDATLLRHDGRTWIVGTTAGMPGGSTCDALSLFHAPDLFGDFKPHALNPVLVDAGSARPAGHIRQLGGRSVRVAQDCRTGYGTTVALATIDRLDEQDYRQTTIGSLRAPANWAASGLHTFNMGAGFEAIDILSAAIPLEQDP